MKTVKVTISGVSPLLMNRFTEENEIAVSSGVSKTVKSKTQLSPREQAEKKAYIDESGDLYLPATNIFAAMINAGKFHKVGKSKLTTIKSSLIPAGVFMNNVLCSFHTKEWEVDTRSVVSPATGGRVICHRPRLDNWTTSFVIDVDDEMFSLDLIREVIDDAGSKVGLGDYRPDRKGPFGRFKVTGWEVME